MTRDFEIRGTEKLAALGQALRGVDKALRRESLRTLRTVAKPAIGAARHRARTTLPQRGGLAALVARSRISTQVKTSGKVVRMRVSTRTRDPRIDKGIVRHPTFGDREDWREQRVTPGWFSVPMHSLGPATRAEALKSIETISQQIRRAAR